MALGTFTVTVDGNQLGLGTETAASIRVQFASGRQFVIDSDAGLFVFPHLSNSKPVAVSLPYELTLVTDVDTGVSEEIGYVVTVTTAAGGRVAAGPFPAQADGAAIALTDVTSDFEGQVSESLALRAEEAAVAAEAAQAAAEAVGATNDGIVEALIENPASATATALSATFARKLSTTDRIVYVSKSAAANDSNDGLSWGGAKATLQAAYDALPSNGGRIEVGIGSWALPSGAVGFQILPTKPVEIRGMGRDLSEFTYSGTGIAVKIGDGRKVTDFATTNASTTVTSATAAFTSADVGRVVFAEYVGGDVTIASVTNSTTAVLSAAATGTATGKTAWFMTRAEHLGTLRQFRVVASHASAATTGIQLNSIHNGLLEDVRVLGNSYNVGSVGIHVVDGYVFYYNRCVVQSFETGIFLDGFCNDTSITDTNIGAKVACVLVKDSTDVRCRGGQWSTTGLAAGGAGVKAIVTGFGNPGGDPVGNGAGLVIDQVHFENNNIGMDVCVGRVSDGSTYAVRNPKIHGRLPSGGTIDRATAPTIENLTLFGAGTFTLTSNCTDPVFVGEPSLRDTATIADSSTRTRARDRDVTDILAARVPLTPWLAGDAFTRADAAGSLGTSDSGHAWANTSGTWNLTSKAAVPAGAGNNIATVDVGSSAQWATVEIGANPATVTQWLIARLVDASNYYRVGVFPTTVELHRVIAGAVGAPNMILIIPQAPAAGDSIGLRCVGTSLTVYRNGQIIGRVTDSTHSGTRAGFKADATTAILRKFRVRSSA